MRVSSRAASLGAAAAALAIAAASSSDPSRLFSSFTTPRPPTVHSQSAAPPGGTTTVRSFGLNLSGQLGLGHDRPCDTPSPVPLLPASITSIAAGNHSSAAVARDGTLFTWGSNSHGQLTHASAVGYLNLPTAAPAPHLPHLDRVSVGGFHMAAVERGARRLWAWGRGRVGGAVEEVAGGTGGFREVACGRRHSAAVGRDGEVWTWGVGFEGALGTGGKGDRDVPTRVEGVALDGVKAKSVACGRDFTLILTEDGRVFSCGADDYGQLGQGRGHGERYVREPRPVLGSPGPISAISAGDYHACALTVDGAVVTWGMGRDGQLGHGEKTDQAVPKVVEGLRAEAVAAVECGGGHTGAVTTDGRLFLWGRGRDGQLGRGNVLESVAAYRTTPIEIDALADVFVTQVALGADHTLVLGSER